MSTITATLDVEQELQHLTDLLADLQAQLDEATETLRKIAILNATPIQD